MPIAKLESCADVGFRGPRRDYNRADKPLVDQCSCNNEPLVASSVRLCRFHPGRGRLPGFLLPDGGVPLFAQLASGLELFVVVRSSCCEPRSALALAVEGLQVFFAACMMFAFMLNALDL